MHPFMHGCKHSRNNSKVPFKKLQNNDCRLSVLGSCRSCKVFLSQFYPFKSSLFLTFSFLMIEKSFSIIITDTHACPIGMVINIWMDRETFLAIFEKGLCYSYVNVCSHAWIGISQFYVFVFLHYITYLSHGVYSLGEGPGIRWACIIQCRLNRFISLF